VALPHSLLLSSRYPAQLLILWSPDSRHLAVTDMDITLLDLRISSRPQKENSGSNLGAETRHPELDSVQAHRGTQIVIIRHAFTKIPVMIGIEQFSSLLPIPTYQ
jgi:hypothetical protein